VPKSAQALQIPAVSARRQKDGYIDAVDILAKPDDFGLSKRDKRLLHMAADAAEQSYRRGVQQGAVAMRHCIESKGSLETKGSPDLLDREIYEWRFQRRPYRASIGAPGLGPPEKGVTVLDRFLRESAGEAFYSFLWRP
jgi:hypothetical protein